ncbi:MAG: proline--tRNA ligase [Candidatus Micrarchaeia archaeon]
MANSAENDKNSKVSKELNDFEDKEQKSSKDSKGITAKKSDFGNWYQEILVKSGFIDYSDISGCIILKPPAYFAWDAIRNYVDERLKKLGVENVYFPLFIPEKYLIKEKEHFAGFKAEVAWVTHGGDSKLEERLAVRPTSETIMYVSYAKWIRSWRDLPLRYNQWNNVVRWEFKHPMPFIRGREFLWNEGHSVFATETEALAEREPVLELYAGLLRDVLALPYIKGQKSDKEKFAGAVASYSLEMLMPDGWAIQGPVFHYDGQNFAKGFDITFLDKTEKMAYVYQNTYAVSMRVLGVMVAMHSDEKGLVLPPKLAHIQLVIVPILGSNNEKVLEKARELKRQLDADFRVYIDDREIYTPGYKFNEWELKGIPIRIEVGPRDLASNSVVIVRRDTGAKESASIERLKEKISAMIEDIHNSMYNRALKFLNEHITTVESYDEFKHVLASKGGFVQAAWCGDVECENKIKEETGAKITNLPFEHGKLSDKCIYCGRKAEKAANFARSY